jgi:hypothetical protein
MSIQTDSWIRLEDQTRGCKWLQNKFSIKNKIYVDKYLGENEQRICSICLDNITDLSIGCNQCTNSMHASCFMKYANQQDGLNETLNEESDMPLIDCEDKKCYCGGSLGNIPSLLSKLQSIEDDDEKTRSIIENNGIIMINHNHSSVQSMLTRHINNIFNR